MGCWCLTLIWLTLWIGRKENLNWEQMIGSRQMLDLDLKSVMYVTFTYIKIDQRLWDLVRLLIDVRRDTRNMVIHLSLKMELCNKTSSILHIISPSHSCWFNCWEISFVDWLGTSGWNRSGLTLETFCHKSICLDSIREAMFLLVKGWDRSWNFHWLKAVQTSSPPIWNMFCRGCQSSQSMHVTLTPTCERPPRWYGKK
jgi:hypothetical protein